MDQKSQVLEAAEKLTEIVKSQKDQNKDEIIFMRQFSNYLVAATRNARSNPPSQETIDNLISKLNEVQEALIESSEKRINSVSSLVGVVETIVSIIKDKPTDNQLH